MTPTNRLQRGAVYVEFIIAFGPLFLFFLCLVQMAGIYVAKLATLHAAQAATRAAMVVVHDDRFYYGDVEEGRVEGARRDDITRAAALELAAVQSFSSFKITFPSSAGGDDDQTSFGRDALVRVKVSARY
jgi:hypothetical protein